MGSDGLAAAALVSLIATYALLLVQIKLDDGKSVMSKVQYLASTSGGSWFNAAFSYKVRWLLPVT
jgi:hypothetical protein